MANTTYLNNVNTDTVQDLMDSTTENVKYFNDTALTTAREYSKPLDVLMSKLYKIVVNPQNIETHTLENYYLELTNTLYFMGEKLEQLGVFGDMSKAAAKEVYNKAYLDNQIKDSEKKNKTTVAENQAVAEESSKYESVVNSIYDHAYKITKYKIDAAYEMVNTLRKIITHRIQEESLSMYQPKNSFVSREGNN